VETIRILIADDHPLVRCGVREVLRAAEDIALVDEASRGDEAQRLCRELQPDVLLLDLQMPGATATETIKCVREACGATRIIILTAYDDKVYVRQMLAAGAVGYILKDEVAEVVITAIRSVMQGGTWLSRRVLETLTTQPVSAEANAAELSLTGGRRSTSFTPPMTAPLSRQQRTVLRLVEQDLTNDEIAQQLCISPKTVKKHLEDIYQRLHVHDRMTAARVARERHPLD